MEIIVPGSWNGPSTKSYCKLVNWLTLACESIAGIGSTHSDTSEERLPCWQVSVAELANGSQAATTFTGLCPELKRGLGS